MWIFCYCIFVIFNPVLMEYIADEENAIPAIVPTKNLSNTLFAYLNTPVQQGFRLYKINALVSDDGGGLNLTTQKPNHLLPMIHSLTINGSVKCAKNPGNEMAVQIDLWESDPLFDSFMGTAFADKNGNYSVSGYAFEDYPLHGGIDPFLIFKYSCGTEKKYLHRHDFNSNYERIDNQAVLFDTVLEESDSNIYLN